MTDDYTPEELEQLDAAYDAAVHDSTEALIHLYEEANQGTLTAAEEFAENYDPTATLDDGSCHYWTPDTFEDATMDPATLLDAFLNVDLGTLLTVIVVGSTASTIFGILSFGLPQIFVVGWVIAFEWFGLGTGDLHEVTAYFCITEIVSCSLQLFIYRKHAPWRVLAIVTPVC